MEQLLLFRKCKFGCRCKNGCNRKKCKKCKNWAYYTNLNSKYCDNHQRIIDLPKTEQQKHKKTTRKEWFRKQMKENPIFRIRWRLRKRIHDILKGKSTHKSSKIGCTSLELKKHLELSFTSEMSWENYGKVWHVDHIKPISKFNLLNSDELYKVNNFRNLQSLLAKDNLKKGSKYEGN